MSEWISVEDRLPEEGVQVLTFPESPLLVRHLKEDGDWFFSAFPVTHWMPLPGPPETDND